MIELALLLAGMALPLQATGDEGGATLAPATASHEGDLSDGLWPSEKLTRLMLARWAADTGDRYGLDEDQTRSLGQTMGDRWMTYLKKNRSQIQPAANEFIEMRMELEAPSKERVMAWAKKAMPIFKSFRNLLVQSTGDVRKVLKPTQRAKFELEALQFGVGLGMAEAKLKQWVKGEFEPREFWEPTRAEYRRQRAERMAKTDEDSDGEAEEVEQGPPDQIAAELEAWEKYVEGYMDMYGFDDGQQSAARSCLEELTERAIAHRNRYRDRINRLEGRIANHSGSEKELAEIKQHLVELYGPIDTMFNELKKRLQSIPTTEQRARVDKRGEEAGG